MFIELHTVSDGKPLLVGTNHIFKINASPKEGTVIQLVQMQTVVVRESYRDIRKCPRRNCSRPVRSKKHSSKRLGTLSTQSSTVGSGRKK